MTQQTTDIKLHSQGQPLAEPLLGRIAPSAEHQRLELLVGKWNREGETYASADVPAVKVTGTEYRATFAFNNDGNTMTTNWE